MSVYPAFAYITDITNAINAVVTTLADHDFTEGEIISLRVSRPYGMFEVNEKRARILSYTNDTFTLDFDTSTFNSFIYPVSGSNTPPVAIPSSSGIVPDMYVSTVTLADAFDVRKD